MRVITYSYLAAAAAATPTSMLRPTSSGLKDSPACPSGYEYITVPQSCTNRVPQLCSGLQPDHICGVCAAVPTNAKHVAFRCPPDDIPTPTSPRAMITKRPTFNGKRDRDLRLRTMWIESCPSYHRNLIDETLTPVYSTQGATSVIIDCVWRERIICPDGQTPQYQFSGTMTINVQCSWIREEDAWDWAYPDCEPGEWPVMQISQGYYMEQGITHPYVDRYLEVPTLTGFPGQPHETRLDCYPWNPITAQTFHMSGTMTKTRNYTPSQPVIFLVRAINPEPFVGTSRYYFAPEPTDDW
ncbi:hypothetical protein CC78DRAFT_584392 [Lojkania enalia]|uniref:Uncharacterized protein n=1 Tax=Lojkania enalia TaxID=147567 RepID=A0A9P4K2T9_9PLEO|nr:hypothetical protein CC78DRAFT_584392 [Didymosphaeria enalia]